MTTREPQWHALLVFGLLLLLTAAQTYQYALQLEQEPHLFLTADWRTKRLITYITAKRYQPTLGSAGCACLFAVPGLLVFAYGLWDLRRWCR